MNEAEMVQVLNTIHGLTDPDAQRRDTAADEVTDILTGLSPGSVHVLSAVLAAARLVESSDAAREAQLHALFELDACHPSLCIPVLRMLGEIDPLTVTGSQVEYLDELLPPRA